MHHEKCGILRNGIIKYSNVNCVYHNLLIFTDSIMHSRNVAIAIPISIQNFVV